MASAAPDERLSAWMDGELDDAEKVRLEADLASDADLRSQLQELEAAVALFKEHAPVRAPDALYAAVMAAADAEPVQLAWYQRLRRPGGWPIEGLAIAAAAALVLVLAWPVSQDGESGAARMDKTPSYDLPPAPVRPEQKGAAQVGTAEAEPPPQLKTTQPTPSAPDVVAEGEADVAEPLASTGAKGEVVGGTGDLAAPGFSYNLEVDDPQAQLAVLRIAGRYQGEVTRADREPLRGDELLETGLADLVVSLPRDALQAFGRDIAKVGGTLTTQGDNRMIAGDAVPVRVTLSMTKTAVKKGTKPSTAPKGKGE
jgi:negative regulator of sigma E activity